VEKQNFLRKNSSFVSKRKHEKPHPKNGEKNLNMVVLPGKRVFGSPFFPQLPRTLVKDPLLPKNLWFQKNLINPGKI